MKETLALIAIVKNETKYLLEWIAHYRSIGIRNIIIYDNDSNDEGKLFLSRLAEADIITLIPWSVNDGTSPQLSAYADAVSRLRDRFEFMAFFDADEFLTLAEGVDINRWLDSLPDDVGAVAVNQRVFGSSGHKTATADLVTERFTQAAEETYRENRWVKSIYRSSCIARVANPHRGMLISGRYILPCGTDAFDAGDFGGEAIEIDFSTMRLHHYIIKSLEEFLEKRDRGGGAAATREHRLARYADLNFFHGRDPYINKVTDLSLAARKDVVLSEMEQVRHKAGLAESSPPASAR